MDTRTATSSCVYSASGDRLIRRQGGTTTVYLPGGQEVTLTTATSVVSAMRYYSFAGQTVAVRTGKAGSTVSSLVADPHQTATVAVANTTQVVTKRRFDPYGNVRGTKPTWPGDHAFLNKPLDTTGLSAVGARYYDAAIGRFISVDPVLDLGPPQQWAAYSYADNNPITYWDPTGLLSWGKMLSSANRWVKKHQAEIVGAVVGTVVTSACLAASWGVGSVGCAAMGGAAGGAASNLWRSFKQKTQKSSWRSLAIETSVGAVLGAAGGPGIPGAKAASAALRGGSSLKGAASAGLSAGGQAIEEATQAASSAGKSALARLRSNASAAPSPPAQVLQNKSAGDAAADAIAAGIPGARREVTLEAGSGLRRLDVLTPDGTAIESKVGRTSLSRSVRQQVERDVELLNDPFSGVNSVEWHFSVSGVTGRGGPTGPLERLLTSSGIAIR